MTAIDPRKISTSPAALELAKRRAAERNREVLRSRRPAPIAAAEPDQDDEPTRWSPDEIDAATTIAEASKLPGELPRPRSSFERDRYGEFSELGGDA